MMQHGVKLIGKQKISDLISDTITVFSPTENTYWLVV